MDEVYCPTAARNEVLLLLSWLTVVLVLFSRRPVRRSKPTGSPPPTDFSSGSGSGSGSG